MSRKQPKDIYVGDYVIYYVSNPRSSIDFPSGYNWAVARVVTDQYSGRECYDLEDAFHTKRDAIHYATPNSN